MSDTCGDCGVAPGTRHEKGCDVARCNVHGTQYISCDFCYEYDEDDNEICLFPGAMPTVWTGEWPGVVECREYEIYTSNPMFLEYRPGETRTEDLNLLAMLSMAGFFIWSEEHERWMMQWDTRNRTYEIIAENRNRMY